MSGKGSLVARGVDCRLWTPGLVLLALACVLFTGGGAAAGPTNQPMLSAWLLYAKPAAGRPGGLAWVQICGNVALASVEGIDLTLDYSQPATAPPLQPPSAPADVMAGERMTNGNPIANWATPGSVHFGVITLQPASGAGSYAILPLMVPANAVPGTLYTLALSLGKVVVATPNDDLEFQVPTQGATLEVSSTLPGDVNGDGRVTIADVVLAIRIFLGAITPTPDQFLAADFNGDGTVTLDDIRALLRQVVLGPSVASPAGSSPPVG